MSKWPDNGSFRTDTDTDERGWGGLIVWVLVSALTILIAVSVIDGQGRKEYHHTEALPSTVHQLSPKAYLVEEDGPPVVQICEGSPSGEENIVNSAQQVPGLSATYVECSHEQQWNVDLERSKNWGHSFVWFFLQPAVWIGAALLTLLCFLPWMVGIIGDYRGYRRAQRVAAANAKQRLTEGQSAKASLTELWATDKINDLEYDQKLDVLHAKYPELLR